MHSSPLLVLWDASPLWGVLLARALGCLGVPHRLVRASALPELLGQDTPALLVPGGSAKRKAQALGEAGTAAIRDYVAGGGTYLGFCGGAGLGLADSLGLCPWHRQPLTIKLQHFLSGHIHVTPARRGASPLVADLLPPELPEWPTLPVWWPARFAPCPHPGVEPLAVYGEPAPDFMVADLKLRDLPVEVLADWQALYGVGLWPDFLTGEPALAAARFGAGRAVLSYAHLETPDSPHANLWLNHLLRVFLGQPAGPAPILPPWNLRDTVPATDDAALRMAWEELKDIVRLGEEHHLLYWREPWLLGWRRGLPGAALSSLLALVETVIANPLPPEAEAYWASQRDRFAADLEVFLPATRGYLLAERLAVALRDDTVTGLVEQKRSLFGPPPGFGGLLGELMAPLSELARVCLSAR